MVESGERYDGKVRILAVAARRYERDAFLSGSPTHGRGDWLVGETGWTVVQGQIGEVHVDAVVADVGAVVAAIAATTMLERFSYACVLSVGIAGAFPDRGANIGDVVVGRTAILADVHEEAPAGSVGGSERGWPDRVVGWGEVVDDLERGRIALAGDIVTISRQTSVGESVAALSHRYPTAIAEAMEGAGVGLAAAAFGTPFIELRGISNVVGVSDRTQWNKTGALKALAFAVPPAVKIIATESHTD